MFTFNIIRDKKSFLIVALIFSLPLKIDFYLWNTVVHNHLGGAQADPQVLVSDIFILLLYIEWYFSLVKNKKQPFRLSNTDRVGIIFLVWSIFSIYNCKDTTLLGFEFIKMVKIYLLYFYFANRIDDLRIVRKIIFSLLIVIIIQGALAIYQYKYGSPYWIQKLAEASNTVRVHEIGNMLIQRVSGTLGYATDFAFFIAPITVMIFSVYVGSIASKKDAIYIMSFIAGSIALLLSFSRAGWISLLIGIIVICIYYFPKKQKAMRTVKLLLPIGVVLLSSILLFRMEILARIGGYDYGSSFTRIKMYKNALEIIKQHPIFGIGLNQYTIVMHNYDNWGYLKNIYYPVHNAYLFLAAEIGLPGLLLFSLFACLILRHGVIALKKSEGEVKTYLIGLILAVVIIIFQSMFDTGFKYMIPVWNLLFLFLGLIETIYYKQGWFQDG